MRRRCPACRSCQQTGGSWSMCYKGRALLQSTARTAAGTTSSMLGAQSLRQEVGCALLCASEQAVTVACSDHECACSALPGQNLQVSSWLPFYTHASADAMAWLSCPACRVVEDEKMQLLHPTGAVLADIDRWACKLCSYAEASAREAICHGQSRACRCVKNHGYGHPDVRHQFVYKGKIYSLDTHKTFTGTNLSCKLEGSAGEDVFFFSSVAFRKNRIGDLLVSQQVRLPQASSHCSLKSAACCTFSFIEHAQECRPGVGLARGCSSHAGSLPGIP